MRGGVQHQVVILEAPILRARAIVQPLRREPRLPAGSVGIMDQGLREQALRCPLPDRSRKPRRGDRKAPFLEQLEREPVRRPAPPATYPEIDAFLLEIHLAVLDLQYDPQ